MTEQQMRAPPQRLPRRMRMSVIDAALVPAATRQYELGFPNAKMTP